MSTGFILLEEDLPAGVKTEKEKMAERAGFEPAVHL
jgi:hypothetical protein